MSDTKLHEEMELWWVPANPYRAKELVTVVKVGRKWAELSNRFRIDVDTMEGDGGKGYSSPGKAWPSQVDYEAYMAIQAAWNDLRNDIYKMWRSPPGVSVESINSLRQQIGLEVSEFSP